MSSFVGTGALVRLALRRDRLMLPIWIVVLGVMPASIANAYETFYPSAADRAGLTATIGGNPSVAVIYGPAFDLSTAGGFTAWRIGGLLAVFTALMAIFTVTRHSRAEEDSGRAELLASGAVGRSALLTAAIAVAGGASLLIGMLEALVLIAADLPVAGAVALGLATAATGVVFAAIAAVACQLAADARTANGIAAGVLGLAFLLRAVGDSTTGARWLSWLSPIGWAQQLRPFAGERWWVLALPALTAAGAGALAFFLLPRRDIGAGVLPPRPGPRGRPRRWPAPSRWRGACSAARCSDGRWAWSRAARCSARSPMGSATWSVTASRRRRSSSGWAGRAGSSTPSSPPWRASTGWSWRCTACRRRCGCAPRRRPTMPKSLLATPVGRLQWAASHLVFAFGGSGVILLAAGAATGVTHGLRSASLGQAVGDMVVAAAAQIPAMWLVVAVGVTLFGAAPKLSVAAWGVAGLALAISMFGPVLDVPQFVLDLSPFSHVPKLPGAEVTATPLVLLCAAGALALLCGLGALRRRDIG